MKATHSEQCDVVLPAADVEVSQQRSPACYPNTFFSTLTALVLQAYEARNFTDTTAQEAAEQEQEAAEAAAAVAAAADAAEADAVGGVGDSAGADAGSSGGAGDYGGDDDDDGYDEQGAFLCPHCNQRMTCDAVTFFTHTQTCASGAS